MTKDLERDLGLPSVLAISIGAMIGSGIFILPALALKIAGPAVIVAYALAGLLVVPAALSKSEMATAMPEAGGTYIYIERGMGPLLGTIAGVGTWFSLSFKGALALVGGVPYLLLLVDLPLKPVALGLAANHPSAASMTTTMATWSRPVCLTPTRLTAIRTTARARATTVGSTGTEKRYSR